MKNIFIYRNKFSLLFAEFLSIFGIHKEYLLKQISEYKKFKKPFMPVKQNDIRSFYKNEY
jgi:hypothetical protein